MTRQQWLDHFKGKDQTLKEIYDTLNKIYSTPYPDSEQEQDAAIQHLKTQFLGLSGDEQDALFYEMINKMFDLVETTGDFKSKLNRVIAQDFWTKEYKRTIVFPKANKNQV